jgi:hypothetical protein
MKFLLYFLLYIFSFTSLHFSQVKELYQIKVKLENKVSVGSSVPEVKNVLGKPNAVEGGFPNSDSLTIISLPKLVGQLNNSTWFYFLPKRKIIYDVQEGELYYLNGIEVSGDIYDDYKQLDSIYIRAGKPIPIAMASSYISLRDEKLQLVAKNKNDCYMKKIKAHKESMYFFPIVCVIFDKGTQVVAATKVYFQLVY